jgi:hypothetical protein
LWLSSVTRAQAGDYRVKIRNPFGTVLSTAARLEVLAPPSIVAGPLSQVLEPGQTLVLSVVASGDEALQYQWLLNGTTLERETDPTLRIDNAQWEHSGSYSVVVANPVGAVESNPAEVQVGIALLGLTDAFDDRPAYVGLTGIGRGSTVGATREPGEPEHGDWLEGASVWLGWQAPADGILHVSTRGSGFDTLNGIYTGERVEELALVAWDDDSGPHLTSYLAVKVTAGTVYNFVVDGYAGQQGSVVLAWILEVTDERLPVIVSGPDSVTVGLGDSAVFEVQALPAEVVEWVNPAPSDNRPRFYRARLRTGH